MFVVIYEFKLTSVKHVSEFKRAWKAITQLMLDNANSLGSRLHREDERTFVAYAQWPDKEHWERAGEVLPDAVEPHRIRMRAVCEHVKTLHELEVESGHDLLAPS